MTIRREQLPSRLCAAISRIASIDSCLARIDERAGVHDEHVRADELGDDLVAGLSRQSQHHLAVDEVLRATQGKETDFHR